MPLPSPLIQLSSSHRVLFLIIYLQRILGSVILHHVLLLTSSLSLSSLFVLFLSLHTLFHSLILHISSSSSSLRPPFTFNSLHLFANSSFLPPLCTLLLPFSSPSSLFPSFPLLHLLPCPGAPLECRVVTPEHSDHAALPPRGQPPHPGGSWHSGSVSSPTTRQL